VILSGEEPQLAPCLDSRARGFSLTDRWRALAPEPSPRLRRLARMGKKPPAPSGIKRPSQPETLGDMRALGVRSVYVTCSACGYASTVNVDDRQDDVVIRSLGLHVQCEKCGNLGAVVQPDWTELRGMPETRRKG
jgi:hypothetical protein